MLLSEHSKEPNMILLSLKKGLYVFFKFKEKTGASSYTPPFFCLFHKIAVFLLFSDFLYCHRPPRVKSLRTPSASGQSIGFDIFHKKQIFL